MAEIGFTFTMNGPEQRQICIKPVDFLKGVTKAVIKAASGAYTDALAELPDVATSLGIKATPQQRVGSLVLRALERSLTSLVSELAKEREQITPSLYAASFLGLSEDLTFEVDRDFFENPNAAKLVDVLRPDAERWLSTIGVAAVDIANVLNRLPSVFVRALHDEWRSNATYYGEIVAAMDSPFVGAAIMEQEWARYRAYLTSISEERIFDESFSLKQIYINPRCYFYEKGDRGDQLQLFASTHRRQVEPVKVLRWAHKEVGAWISRQDREFAIRTVSGGPGSGKSSFAKIMASELASANKRVLFVPLHLVDLELGIAQALADYFKQAGHFSNDPLSTDALEPLVLLLDGLDEIQMQGRASQESAQSFVNDLIRYVERKNTASCKLLCIITGRDLAVESAEGSLKIEGQVLHLSPYFLSENEKSFFDDKENIFSVDQRNDWWTRYGILTGLGYKEMPDTLRVGVLGDVTSQPLLNYLVALSHRRGIKLDESTNINSVYEDLLKAVHARGWARNRHPSIKNVHYDSFVRLLEEVALSVWHGAGRTTTLAEVEAHCQQSRVGALLDSFQSGVSSGVSSLLLAFYFRQKGRRDDGSKTFEFTHKTFSEYLISLRIVRLVELVSDQLAAHVSNPDVGFDEQDALHRWLNVCGPAAFDSYLRDFVRREIAFRPAARAAVLQKSLCDLLEFALHSGWPIQRITKLSFNEQQNYVRNAEESLLVCLNACALVSRVINIVRWPSETAAGEMIARLRGQRKGPVNRPAMSCLSYFSFDGQCLDMADLYRAEMHNSSFKGSHLNYTIMFYANVSESNFSGARLEGADLTHAKLSNTIIPVDQLSARNHPISEEEVRQLRIGDVAMSKQMHWVDRLFRQGAIVVDDNGAPMDLRRVISKARSPRASKKS